MQEIGKKIIRLNSVDSTNNYAAKLLKAGNVTPGTVIMADEQLAGRGQRMTQWQSEPGMNLTASVVLTDLAMPVDEQFKLTMMVSLAVTDLLERYGIAALIKWPNDILVDERKICGILIENGLRGDVINHAIVGIGLNVNQTRFDGLHATSIRGQLGRVFQMDEVLFRLIGALNVRFSKLHQTESLRSDYRNKLFGFDQQRRFKDADGMEFDGSICGVEPSGRLLLNTDKGVRSFELKELQFIFQSAV